MFITEACNIKENRIRLKKYCFPHSQHKDFHGRVGGQGWGGIRTSPKSNSSMKSFQFFRGWGGILNISKVWVEIFIGGGSYPKSKFSMRSLIYFWRKESRLKSTWPPILLPFHIQTFWQGISARSQLSIKDILHRPVDRRINEQINGQKQLLMNKSCAKFPFCGLTPQRN